MTALGYLTLVAALALALVGWALFLKERFGGMDADERNSDRDCCCKR